MTVNSFLIFVFYPAAVLASPISFQNSPSGSACLAVILTLIFFLSVLIIVKYAYMKYRRRNHVAHRNASKSSLQSSQRSSSSFFDMSEEKPAKSTKTAFFVGFLGSPAWETGVKALCHHNPSPYTNQIYLQSLRGMNKNRCTSRFSISEFGGRPRHRTSSVTDTLESTLAPSHCSPQLPAYPANAKVNTSTTNRRHSLPTLHPTDMSSNDRRRKRHSSLKMTTSTRSRRSDVPNVTGLRLVSSADEAVARSPLKTESSFLDFELFTQDLTTSTPSKVKSSRSPVPPLPPVPPSILSLQSPGLPRTPEGRSYISHPYALAPRNKHDPNVTTAAYTNNPESRTSTSTTQAALGYSNPPPQSIANTISVNPSMKAATLPRMKPIGSRSPSVRARKSPPIGPSPLRIMTLPQSSLSDIRSSVQDIRKQEYENTGVRLQSSDQTQGDHLVHRSSYVDLGIGYPSSWGAKVKELDSEPATIANTSSAGNVLKPQPSDSDRPAPIDLFGDEGDKNDSDADVMLSIIQELVEETSRWDSSLLMDDSLKALISTHSGKKDSPEKGAAGSSRSNTPKSPKPILKKTMVASKSVEVDLGLLELDAVRMESLRLSTIETPVVYQYDEGRFLSSLAESEEESWEDIRVGLAR